MPAEYAARLTDREGANLAVYAQFLPLPGSVKDDVLRCFHSGSGVPYVRYHRFHEVMAEDSGQTVLPALIDHILPLGAFLYAVSCLHCMTVSLAQGGEGLGTMWGRKRAREYLQRAGFGDVTVHELPHDVMNDYYACYPAASA